MAITNASTLAEYASGIGTQNSTLTVDSGNKRVGVGTTNPLGTFQVGSGVTFWGDAGIGSFTSLKLSGDTDSTSISTGALTVTGGVGIGLSLTVGGDVSVGGTITYEDVTNVDSLGIVTARSGLRVVGGGVTCVGVATFFNDIQVGDKIIHNGDTNTAIRFAEADTVTVETGGSERLRIQSDGKLRTQQAGYIFTSSSAGSLSLYGGNSNLGGGIVLAGGNGDGDIKFYAETGTSTPTERLRIDSSGRILKGLTTARGNFGNNTSGVEYVTQIEGTSAITAGLSIVRNSNDANDGGIILGKTRAGSTGGNTVVQAGDDLGNITFAGSDGTSLLFGAEIYAEVQSGVGNDDMPTDLIFKTNSGSTSTTEVLRIDSSGNIGQSVTPSGWASAQAGDFYAYQVGTGMAIFGRGSGDEDRGGISCNYYHTASAQQYIGNGHAGRIYFEDGSIVLSNTGSTANSSGAGAALTLYDRLRIAPDGKVGVGTLATNPNAKFQVEGASAYAVTSSGRAAEGIDVNATAGGTGNYGSGISFGAGATGRAAIVSLQGASDADNVGLAVITHPVGTGSADGVEKLRIFSSGDIGIGTATMFGDDKIHIYDSSTSNYRSVVIDSAATNGSTFIYKQLGTQVLSIGSGGGNNLSGSDLTHGLIRSEVATVFAVGNSEKLRINSSGNILHVSSGSSPAILNKPTDATPALFIGDSNRTGNGQHLAEFRGLWNGTLVSRMVFSAGDDTTNKDNGNIDFYTAAAGSTTLRLRIDPSGRVGIQGEATKAFLDVRASGGSNTMLTAVFGADEGQTAGTLTDSADKAARVGLHHYDNDEQPYTLFSSGGTTSENSIYFGGGTSLMNAATSIGFYTAANNTTVTGNQRLLIQSDGKLRTQQAGYIFTSSSAGSLSMYGGNTNLGGGIVLTGGNGDGDIKFYAQTSTSTPAERVRIGSNGRLSVGSAGELGTAHAGWFQVINTGTTGQTNDCLSFFETAAADWMIKTNYNTTGPHYHMAFEEEGTTRGTISGSDGGNVSFSEGSDYRWKENIVEMTGTEGIDICKKLKPSKYNWIDNRIATGKINTVDGFIAHEVEEAGVLGAVSGEKDAVNEDGSIKGQMLDYGQMTPVLAAAIKGLIDKVETLEAKVAALES